MTTRVLRFRAYAATDGTPLSGLTPAFDDSGAFYLVNGSTPGTLPTVAAVTGAAGWYGFTATLADGERLAARLVLGATASQSYVDFDFAESDADFRAALSAAPTASAIASQVRTELTTELARVDAAVTSRLASASYAAAPSAADVATEVDSVLSVAHGAGTWGGAGGSGTESVTLTVRADGNAVQGASVGIRNTGGTQVAVQTSDSAGRITVLLSAGNYTARPTLPGYQWPVTPLTVTTADTVSPTTLDGEALPGRLKTREGVSGTCSLTAPAHDAKIAGITAGEDVTLTRVCLAVTSGDTIASAALRWGYASKTQEAGSVAATVTDTGADGTGGFTFALTPAVTRALRRDEHDYEIVVTLTGGTVHYVESGKIRVRPEIG